MQKALEENDPKKKGANQLTDDKRENPTLKHHDTAVNKSIKDIQAVTESEQSKDFSEVSPAATSEFSCEKCGKSFQNQDDLVRHQGYEEGKETSDESRTNKQRTVAISPKPVGRAGEIESKEPTENRPLDRKMAVRMANLLGGLDFPATKQEITAHIENKVTDTNKDISNDILRLLQSKLNDNLEYNNVYEIEKATNLVADTSKMS